MNKDTASQGSGTTRMQAEFDLLADEYSMLHRENVAITGETPEYFSEYKIADLAELLNRLRLPATKILDFGSGIGNSLPYFHKYFPGSEITCADVSARSIEIAQTRFPGQENYVLIDEGIPLPTASQDVVFSACVFHHIPHKEHLHWLAELGRITKPGRILAIYEHNPLNPLTVRTSGSGTYQYHLSTLKKRRLNLAAGSNQGIGGYRLDSKKAVFWVLRTLCNSTTKCLAFDSDARSLKKSQWVQTFAVTTM